MPRLDLTEARRLKQLIVDPVIAALRAEMRETLEPLLKDVGHLAQRSAEQDRRMDGLDGRLGSVERFKLRIVTVCSGIAIVTGIVWRAALDWVRARFEKRI